MQIAILYAYNGSEFNGSARVNGDSSVESLLLNVLATLVPPTDFCSISRAYATEPGEVLSLSLQTEISLPDPQQFNAALPAAIRVFRIVHVSHFSARKDCDAKTFEYLLPTYVFSTPPEATNYCFAPLTEPDEDFMIEVEPSGGLFNTKRRTSLSRRRTFMKAHLKLANAPNLAHMEAMPALLGKGFIPEEGLDVQIQRKLANENTEFTSSLDTLTNNSPSPLISKPTLWERIKNIFRTRQTGGSQQLKTVLNDTLRFGSASAPASPNGFVSTLKRTFSQKKSIREIIDQDISEREGGTSIDYEPLAIPEPTSAILSSLYQFRLSGKQHTTIKNTLALFNGTHNWHNYIPNSTQEDPRNFMRIINVDISQTEMHEGLEWIRVKVQAQQFAKFQIRRMIAMLVMVVRTNTPRSVVGNSFSFTQIEIPDAPASSLILDEPHYNSFNVEAIQNKSMPVNFGDANVKASDFRDQCIFNPIFKQERKSMEFEKWIRVIDNHSFLYTQYLNQNGIILRHRNRIRVPDTIYDLPVTQFGTDEIGKIV